MSNFKFQIPNKSKSANVLEIGNWKLEISAWQNGFTFPEIIIVMGIVTILLGFITFNLLRAQSSSSLASTLDTLITDIKNQQIKAMTGDTEGRDSPDRYGIHFTASQYVLFHGASYNASDTSNVTVSLDSNLDFASNTFPNGNIIFLQTSGEVSSYSATTNSIVLQTTTDNQSKTLTINKYGVITGVQ
ncbi:MAG TPA: type II secretion system protein [Candidatus Eisenbacteria bacterium]|nr:type II secretion system protein [Candidatus Eisenbacteria bacterium]